MSCVQEAKTIARSFSVGLLGIGILMASSLDSAKAQGATAEADLVARGRYLAGAADCMPCHTVSKDKPLRGRPEDQYALRRHLLTQHHAGSRHRHRQVELRGFQERRPF